LNYNIYFHNNVNKVLEENPSTRRVFGQLLENLSEISDEDMIFIFNQSKRDAKSISETLYILINEILLQYNWLKNQMIFDSNNNFEINNQWTLDFIKEGVSVDISIGHSSNVIKNLVKSAVVVKSNTLNKKHNIILPVIITVTREMKSAGGFDSAVGEAEKYIASLEPLKSIVDIPLVIIALNPPKSFYIQHKKNK
jgi:hypothetical protein